MKNLLKFLGIIAIVAIVGFTLASCGGSTSPAEEPPPPPDTSTWQTIIQASETLNGYMERIDGDGQRVLYAKGTASVLKFEKNGDGNGYIVSLKDDDDFDPLTVPATVYIPAYYSPTPIKSDKTLGDAYLPVKEIKDGGFAAATGITTVVVLEDNTETYVTTANKRYQLKTIGAGAFEGISGLATFVIRKGVEEIGASAFDGTALTKLDIPASVETIGDRAFAGITSLVEISFALDGVLESIGAEAFKGDTGIIPLGVILPASLKEIGAEAFSGMTGTDFISFYGDSVDTIGNAAFSGFIGTFHIYRIADEDAADAKWSVEDDPDTDEDETSDWRAGLSITPYYNAPTP
jgi:hypothetical protein